MTLPDASERFQGEADRYASARPDYPARLLANLSRAILREPPPAGGAVVDVGSGTGIFTRQVRALLPMDVPIVGIEPAEDMRAKAERMSVGEAGIAYRDGLAQQLPLGDSSARAVVAATAAHWFERPEFYREAHRVLLPSGILAIVEMSVMTNDRPAAAVVAFLAHHGGARAYVRPNYTEELPRADGFHGFAHQIELVTLRLTPDAFTSLALSSSHARAVIDTLGEAAARHMLFRMVAPIIAGDGQVPFGYLFHLFTVRRN